MMPVKMISETPLPTPRAVICSPIHRRSIVPPTNVVTVVTMKNRPGSIAIVAPVVGSGRTIDSAIARPCAAARMTVR